MTVADFLAFTKRHWLLLLASTLIGLLVGAGYWVTAPKTYESSSSGFVAMQGSSAFSGADSAISRAAAYLPLITSTPVREKIAETAGVPVSSLNGRLSASIPEDATLIRVTATASDPESAVTLANGALSALGEVITEIEAQIAPEEGSTALVIVPMENAVAPTSPIAPDLRMSLGIGALVGLVLGYAIAIVHRITDVKVRTGTDLETLTGAGLLGRIPYTKAGDGEDLLTERAGEALRQIRTGLRFASVDDEVRSVVFTSAHQGEGKTTIAAAVARMIARGGTNTIVVDADLRRPHLAEEMGMDGTVGLSQVLSGQASLADALRATDDPHLFVLPAGAIPPNPSEMLGSAAMKTLLQELTQYGAVIIDAPPVLPVTDALLVGSAADGVVLIASAGKTHTTDLEAMRGLLDQAKVRVLGCILNRVRAREAADGYSYKRQYQSYYATTAQASTSKAAPVRTAAPSPTTVTADEAWDALLAGSGADFSGTDAAGPGSDDERAGADTVRGRSSRRRAV